jgi:tetratricopeptide (TPR) repeat protein
LQRWAADLKGPRQQDVLAEMDVEIENARAAWDWAVERIMIPELAMALDGLCAYYQSRGRLVEGQAACRSLVDGMQGTAGAGEEGTGRRLLARALTWQGLFTRLTGYAEAAGPLLDRSIALLDALESAGQDVRAERAFVLLERGRQAFDLDRALAGHCLEQSLDLYRTLDDRWGVAESLYMLGWLSDGLGSYDRARRLLDESLSMWQALGDRQGTARTLSLLGLIALRVGQLEQGETLLQQSVVLLREMDERIGLADGLHYLGFAVFLQGRFEQGIVLQEECFALAKDLALGHPQGMAQHGLATYHAMLGRYEQARAHATAGLAHACARGDTYVVGVMCLVLGLTSLVQEDYAAAQSWFGQSLAAYRGMGQRDGESWSRAFLGYAALGLGDLAQARLYLGEALQTGASVDSFLAIAIALSGVALWMARTDDVEHAVELWALLSRYPLVSNAPLFQDIVGQYIDAAAASLPLETVAAAQERGLTGDLDAVAGEVLDRLGG